MKNKHLFMIPVTVSWLLVAVLWLLVAALLLSSCSSSEKSPTTPQATSEVQTTPADTVKETPSFESADCPFELPPDQTVECGYLIVPQDRADPNSPHIRLAVATFRHPDGATHPDPIVYLAGGPGGSGLEMINFIFNQRFAPLFETQRDIIIFDQRGIGYSQPALDCPELTELNLELLDGELDGEPISDQQAVDMAIQTLLDCKQDLSAITDLADYNTVSSAADVNDLRLALGYDKINLWGISYGTRLALGVMRDYPQGLRSVVLDSVYPPDIDLYLEMPANTDRAFDTLFEGCAADPACNAAYPNLRTVFWETVEQLNQNPAYFETMNSLTRERYEIQMDGYNLVGILFRFLYMTDVLPSLPQIIYDAEQDNFDLIALVYGSLLAEQEVMSIGQHLSVQCHEELGFSSLESYEKALAEYPELADMLRYALTGKLSFDICAEWDSGQAGPLENQPITSDVPTLAMAGEYDPITPPAWARRTAETLANSYVFEYAGVGHGASMIEGCPREMLLAFINDPGSAPDSACLADMGISFQTPGAEQAITLEPFTNPDMGIQGVSPSGWEQTAPGAYNRGDSNMDVVSLIQQAAPASAQDMLETLVKQLGLESAPESVGERQANQLAWTLYEVKVQGIWVDIALTESDDWTLIVFLQSIANERDTLYQNAFLPAIDALVRLD